MVIHLYEIGKKEPFFFLATLMKWSIKDNVTGKPFPSAHHQRVKENLFLLRYRHSKKFKDKRQDITAVHLQRPSFMLSFMFWTLTDNCCL